jgi:hypothetical protein
MRVCVTLEHRFFGTPDGSTWTVTQFPYRFFLNYLDVFDSVRVIARVFPVAKAESDFQRADGPGVEFYRMPAYAGPFQFARRYREVKLAARDSVQHDDASILRVHSQVANSGRRVVNETPTVFCAGSCRRSIRRSGPQGEQARRSTHCQALFRQTAQVAVPEGGCSQLRNEGVVTEKVSDCCCPQFWQGTRA